MRDRMTDEQIVEVVQARIAGKRIQWRRRNMDRWLPFPKQCDWDFALFEYRVAPPKTIYVNENGVAVPREPKTMYVRCPAMLWRKS
jgi:hypothetical protein